MRLGKLVAPGGAVRVAVVSDDSVTLLPAECGSLADLLATPNPRESVERGLAAKREEVALADVRLLPPIDHQEVWAAGVTYRRSRQARMDESEGAASFYDKVYAAERPELFFKATARRVAGPDQEVRVRADSRWCVPEPELTAVLSPTLAIVGYTAGNDMSARDIEGENPLYLPQAKVYDQCAGLGPVIALADSMPPLEEVSISMEIERAGTEAFRGSAVLSQLNRSVPDLVGWLGRDSTFPDGAFLMTGTGIVPPDDFTLADGDLVRISIDGIGTLRNRIVGGPP